jgi:O-antigen biosynthesis protein WbqP
LIMENDFRLRMIDIILALFGLLFLIPLMMFLFMLGLFDTGSPLFRQLRIGRHQRPFVMVKFRTMGVKTENLASHLVSDKAVTRLGSVLRRTKLDELPQLWNVLCGDMSIVGPRPGLPNQYELTRVRSEYNVYSVRPGITGLAQVNRIDMSTPILLAQTDAKMIQKMTVSTYFKYIFETMMGKGAGDAVRNR